MKTRIFILALLCTFGFCALPMYGHAALNNTASTVYDSEINTTETTLDMAFGRSLVAESRNLWPKSI